MYVLHIWNACVQVECVYCGNGTMSREKQRWYFPPPPLKLCIIQVLVVSMKRKYVYLFYFFSIIAILYKKIYYLLYMISRVYSFMMSPIIIHNAYTCTSLLPYPSIDSFVMINTSDLYVNG